MTRVLTWPLRLGADGSLATAEQDSDEDRTSTVLCALSYPKGWRFDDPEFGRPELVFRQNGVDAAQLAQDLNELGLNATPEVVAGVLEEGAQHVKVDPGRANG